MNRVLICREGERVRLNIVLETSNLFEALRLLQTLDITIDDQVSEMAAGTSLQASWSWE